METTTTANATAGTQTCTTPADIAKSQGICKRSVTPGSEQGRRKPMKKREIIKLNPVYRQFISPQQQP
jgi:hypothetical protein